MNHIVSRLLFALVPFVSFVRAEPTRPALPKPKLSVPLPDMPSGKGAKKADRSPAEEVAEHYLVQAHNRYAESLEAAKRLFETLRTLVASPSEASHAAAKAAWIEAHRIYSRTEVLRFGNPNVDAWETRVNAWPVDEGFLDYVSPRYFYEGGESPRAIQPDRRRLSDRSEFHRGSEERDGPEGGRLSRIHRQ